jgi:acetyl esterase/lipase
VSHVPQPQALGAPFRPAGPPPGLLLATSVAPSDTSTSVVLPLPRGPQIELGRVEVAVHADIVYAEPVRPDGTSRQLRLDLLVPKSTGAKALVVYLPGGGFVMALKESGLERRTYVAEAGYAVASIEYRTVPDGATYRDAVADVKSAIRFLRAHADAYGFDAERAAVWGESAGGYLAAMTGATNAQPEFEAPGNQDYSSAVQAVVDLLGPSNLLKLGEDFDPACQAAHLAPGTPSAAFIFGPGTTKSVADDPAAVAAADPATRLGRATPPFVLFHGSADRVVSPSQTLLLHAALLAHGVDSTRYVLDGADHGELAALLGDPEGALPWSTRELLGHIVDFLDKELGR